MRAGGPTATLALLLFAAAVATGCGGKGDRATARLYRDYCARCHGRDGEGMQRPDGFDPGLDLTVSKLVAEGRRDEIRLRIAQGRGTMPGFAHRLDAEEIDRLVDFVLRFAPPAGEPPQ